LNQKISKLKKEIEAADQAYKQGVAKLDETRVKWEEEMTICFSTFESLETSRITKIKEYLAEFAKLDEQVNYFLLFIYLLTFFQKKKN